MNFEEMGISNEVLTTLRLNKVTTPTAIQQEVIPAIFVGKDVLAQSETGSGKTLGFAIPIIEKVGPKKQVQAIVLAPTRELAQQITTEFYKFSRHKKLNILCIYGGVSINPQLDRARFADIVVGTPGRVLDILDRRGLDLSNAGIVVLDEADRMLDMGFVQDIERVLKYTPQQKQTLLFSATIPDQIVRLSKRYLQNPLRFMVKPEENKNALKQYYYSIPKNERFSLLAHLLKNSEQRALIFCRTRRSCQMLADVLKQQNIPAETLHGGMSQAQRDYVINAYKQWKIPILVATDIAARGIHVENITHVYNYELPLEMETYIHRVGRTARAGVEGIAVSFVGIEDRDVFDQVLRYYDGLVSKVDPGQFPRLQIFNQRRGFSNNGMRGSQRQFGNGFRGRRSFGRSNSSNSRGGYNGSNNNNRDSNSSFDTGNFGNHGRFNRFRRTR